MTKDDEQEQSLLVNSDQPYRQLSDSPTDAADSPTDSPTDPQQQQGDFKLSDIPLAVYLIIIVEISERFSYYSMRSLLTLFFKEILGMTPESAKAMYSYFSSGAYFMPLVGSFLSDAILGRFKTIAMCTVVYVIGAFSLVYSAHLASFALTIISLILIAFGTGAIKPNVSVFGAQALRTDHPKALSTYFAAFYASINIGSVCATLLIPKINKAWGYVAAFTFPACGLAIALVVFVSGYKLYVHTPPSSSLYRRMYEIISSAFEQKKRLQSLGQLDDPSVTVALKSKRTRARDLDPFDSSPYLDEPVPKFAETDVLLDKQAEDEKTHWLDYAKFKFRAEHVEELKAVFKVLPIFPFIVFFWMCFDQQGNSFVLAAEKMDRVVWGFEILSAQVTALNAISILILVPLFDRLIYPFCRSVLKLQLKHLNRVLFGMVLTTAAFVCAGYVDHKVSQAEPNTVSIVWQLPQYILLALAELMISVCGIEFVYAQAPKSFKSTMSSFWSLSTACGDFIAGVLFQTVKVPSWKFNFICSGLMFTDFLIFIPVAMLFNKQTQTWYDKQQQDYLHPELAKPDPVYKEYPFAPLSEEEQRDFLTSSSA